MVKSTKVLSCFEVESQPHGENQHITLPIEKKSEFIEYTRKNNLELVSFHPIRPKLEDLTYGEYL